MTLLTKRLDAKKFAFDGAAKEVGLLSLGQNTDVASQDTPTVIFKGFSIEILNFNYSINIQDSFGQKVTGAHVFVTDLGDFLEDGFTDKNGCFFGNADENVTHIITVTKEDFVTYTHRFRILVGTSLLFPTKNFPVLVYNSSNAPISGASVTITAPGHSNSGTTNANGLYEGVVQAGKVNTITISKSGFTTYNQTVNPYLKITCSDNTLVAVPVIVLS